MDSRRPKSAPDQKSRPTIQSTIVRTAKMPRRPTVYITSQGRTFGGVAGPPAGPDGTELSTMTALPFGRQHHGGAGARDAPDPVQRDDGSLECRDVGHTHLEHVALAAGDPPAVLDPGQLAHGLLEAGVVDRVALDDADQRGDVEPHRLGVDDGPVAGDDPGRLELAHPLVHGGRGETHLACQLGVARPAVGAQEVDQLPVHGVYGAVSVRARVPGPAGAWCRSIGGSVGQHRVSPRSYAERGRGGGRVAFLVVLVVAVVVVVLVMRAAAAAPSGGPRAPRAPRSPRRPARLVAPDDDPEFLRELERRTRRDGGSPA